MFIRKKLNRSGSYSVLLTISERAPGKKHSTPITIKNFGSANNDEELKLLLQKAEHYKSQLQTCEQKIKVLKINSDVDIKSCSSHNVGFADIYGNIFNEVFNNLQLNPKLSERLKELIVMRIAHPASKRRTAQISTEYGFECHLENIYKLMDQITDPMITSIKKLIYNHTNNVLIAKKRKIDVLFYDLTTIYFETSSQDDIRDFGFSKDGKHQHVQIMLAIIVTQEGLPIDYEEFAGNCYEGHTLIPVINKIKTRYHIENAVIVADSALMNRINLQELNSNNIKYIISERLKNSKKEVKTEVLNLNDYKKISSSFDKSGAVNDEIISKIIEIDTNDRIIAYHSTKRARKDAHDRQKSLEKIRKYISSTAKSKLTGSLKKPYVKISKNCKIEIDYEKVKIEEQYDGFFGIRTNITNISAKEILSSYRGLWQVEQTFRIAKNNLEIRPVFHYTPRRIKAHFIICYMALALIRYVEFELKNNGLHFPFEQLHLMLDKMRKIKLINSEEEIFEILEDQSPEIISVYQALQLKSYKKFSHIGKVVEPHFS